MSFLIPLIALIIGILIGDMLSLPEWGILPVIIACGIYLYILKQSTNPLKALKYHKAHMIWIFFLFAGIGAMDMAFHKPDELSERELKQFVLAEGEIIRADTYANGDRFVVDVTRMIDSSANITRFNKLKILLSTDGFSAEPGDIVTFPAKFKPLTENSNHRPTGYVQRMNRKGIRYQTSAIEGEIKNRGFNSTLSNSATAWRNRLIAKIEKSSLSRQASAFTVALLLGDRSFLTENVRTTFSNAGVAHILALSGMHVAIIMGLILLLLFPLKLLGLHRIRYIIAICMIWCYTFFTGMSPSTVRASIMTSFVVLALILQRRNSSENALLASLFIILLVTPESIFDIGLQLSALCVGSILLFATQLNPVNRHSHPMLHSVVAAVLISLVATITTWVVISYYFNTIPILFLPVNLCLLPLLPAFMTGAILFVTLLLFGIDLSALGWLLNESYSLFEWIASRLSAFGEATISINVQFPIVIIWLLGVCVLAYALKKKSNKRRIIVIGSVSLMAISIICIPLFNNKTPDGIIFQKNYRDITLALYDGDKEFISSLPRDEVSRIFHKGCEILSIDCQTDIDSLATMIAYNRKSRKRFLILGSGIKQTTLKDIPGINSFDKIILHSSIKRKMETKLKQEALEIGLKTLYSIREEGPLEEILRDTIY